MKQQRARLAVVKAEVVITPLGAVLSYNQRNPPPVSSHTRNCKAPCPALGKVMLLFPTTTNHHLVTDDGNSDCFDVVISIYEGSA
jgi:hypothetical protein